VVEVETDAAVVDDQHRPHVVHVHRIGVVDEPGVQHLADALDGGPPCPHSLGR
jgi:hypothetical protein